MKHSPDLTANLPPGTLPQSAQAAPPSYWSLAPSQLQTTCKHPGMACSPMKLPGACSSMIEFNPGRAANHRLGCFSQFKSPLVLILVFAAIISGIAGEWPDAVIVIASCSAAQFGFVQEYRPNAVEKLRSKVMIKSSVLRDGQPEVLSEDIVPGDVVLLSAGSLIPADGVILEANDLFVNQAVLTGEVFPVEKKPEPVEANASLDERTNCVFMGTSVRSGTARVLIVQTAKSTVFGQIAERLSCDPQKRSLNAAFSISATAHAVMLVMVVSSWPSTLSVPSPLDSLLFALALAVGLAPELLPAIISITLSRAPADGEAGCHRAQIKRHREFRQHGRTVYRQDRTLTEGVVTEGALDAQGQPSAPYSVMLISMPTSRPV